MPTTVYFATNRVIDGDPTSVASYKSDIVKPSDPTAVRYGVALVDGIDIPTNNTGTARLLSDPAPGAFDDQTGRDLASGKNLLVFLHGFDNSFGDALTRAAFNREWLAASEIPSADTQIVAFSWPSLGKLIGFPLPWSDYRHDQVMAQQSALHVMSFLAALDPILQAARKNGGRTCLLAHSMGNLALQSAVEAWFMHGNGPDFLFDEAVLAAGDVAYDTFDYPNAARLSGLSQLARRISIYYSHRDAVLALSQGVNGIQRLGQDGPYNRSDLARFPVETFQEVDCSGFHDYDFTLQTSHQYYPYVARRARPNRRHHGVVTAERRAIPALRRPPGCRVVKTAGSRHTPFDTSRRFRRAAGGKDGEHG